MRIESQLIGMPTLVEFDSLRENINLASELQIGFIEINLDLPIFSNINELKRQIANTSRDLFFTIHLPENLDFCCFEDTFRYCYKQYFEKIVSTLDPIRIKKINGHLNRGVLFNLPSDKLYLIEKHSEEYFEILQESFADISKILSKTGHQLNIENTGIGNIPVISTSIEIILQHKNIKLTRDIGHEIKNKNVDTKYLDRYESKIDHYHIHDYNGIRDHQELFTGNIQLRRILEKVKRKGSTFVIEVKAERELRNSINKLKQKGMIQYNN